MDYNFKFANPPQRECFYSTARNIVFSGGFNNGKTFIAIVRNLVLHAEFPNYRSLMARQTFTALNKTTMQTFFQIVPPEMILSHNEQKGHTVWKNGGITFWLHLDKADQNTLRGFEINNCTVDQAEEIEEGTFDILDSRVGRWSGVEVPQRLLNAFPEWPISRFTGRPLAPSYMLLLSNPDLPHHFIYRKAHPDSEERLSGWHWIHGQWDPQLGSSETYLKLIKEKDPEWISRYIRGEWGYSDAAIHTMHRESLLEPTPELLAKIKSKGSLHRILDHGDSAPTCCLWMAVLDGNIIFYREYYVPGRPISYHRKEITALSEGEEYSASYADPSIFKKASQKDGGFWSVAEEYQDDAINAPELYFLPADNNEFATRNRINEGLLISERNAHPVTGIRPAPGIYFVKKTPDYPNGCSHAYQQLQAQRKLLLSTVNGKNFYADDRDKNVVDHAYDCTRYGIAMHGSNRPTEKKRPPVRSFARFNQFLALQMSRGPQVG